MSTNPKPFDCSYPPQFAELLNRLKISLSISTYQAGKVVFISAMENDKLIQLVRTYRNAMGMALNKNKLAVAAQDEVVLLRNRPELASSYPNKKGIYDGIYIPNARYNTGSISLHDMEFINDKLVGVNTLFSCLSYIDDKYSFTPFWQPPFISELAPEDRCHLNGLACEENEIKYLTALGNTNTQQGWRENKMDGGILIEYPSGKIILDKLAMPHSPRIYNGKLYILNSAQGELICINPENGTSEVVVQLGGFARGMARYGDYLFIGVSKLRHNSKAFSDLEIAKTSFAGVIAVYLPYKSIVGSFKYEMSIDEIYDVKVIPNAIRPSLLSADMDIYSKAISTPNGGFWEVDQKNIQQEIKAKSNTNTKSAQYSYKLLKNISADNLLKNFSPIIFPDFIPRLNNDKFNGSLTALLTLKENKAVAMTVFEVDKYKNANLHSIFVLPAFRKQTIATNMLKEVEKIFSRNNINNAQITINNNIENADIINQLLDKTYSINLISKGQA